MTEERVEFRASLSEVVVNNRYQDMDYEYEDLRGGEAHTERSERLDTATRSKVDTFLAVTGTVDAAAW